ncbi:MAG TPA: MFS transporter [Alphaproteobacteria bacterium]|nr:MFS transporter [Alphaproteobacteria bacterium]
MMRRQGAWRELLASGGLGRFAVVCLGVWLHAADSLATATVVPAVIRDIGGIAYVPWTISLYQIGAVVTGSAAAMLCQRAGFRRVLMGAALVYGAGCVLAAAAPSMAVLLGGRLIQGIGGGMLVALSYVAIQQSFAEHLWGRLFGIVAVIWSAGSLLGPLIGGLFAHIDWRLTFWSFALQAILLVALAVVLLPRPQASAAAPGKWSALPLLLLGAATLAVAEAGLSRRLGVSVAEGLAGLGLLWLAAWLDRGSDCPMLPRETLNLRHPVGLGLFAVFALATSATGFWAYGPLILRVMFGTDPLISGYILAGEAFAWTAGTMAVSGVRPSAAGPLIRAGSALAVLGMAGFALAVPSGSLAAIVLCALLQGLGFGVCWPSLVYLIVRRSGDDEATLSSAAPGTVQRIGYSIGAAATGIAANASGLVDGVTAGAARAAGFWVFAGFLPVLILGLIAAWLFARPEIRSESRWGR